MGNADIDRFSGEAAEAPVSSYCWYCGAEIRLGERYFLHEEVRVCADCVKDYAYSVFERDARIKTAGEE